MKMHRVAILSGEGESHRIMYHSIKAHADVCAVLIETENNSTRILKRRLKRIGLVKLSSQVAFKLLMYPFLSRASRKRRKQIMDEYGLVDAAIPQGIITRTNSVNTHDLAHFVKSNEVDLVLLSGTRILSKKAIKALAVPIWNIHVGINPKYRGVHGGYWSLWSGDAENFGVTLHEVDAGVDTGQVISRQLMKASVADNFSSYPLLQFAGGLVLLKNKLQEEGQSQPAAPLKIESKIWSHPTLWDYLRGRMRGVK